MRKRNDVLLIVTIGVTVGCFIVLFVPTVGKSPPSNRTQCRNNLKQIGAALLSYEAVYGAWPATTMSDRDGIRHHSWRVLILPYVEEQELFDSYEFGEPWNGPRNRRLLSDCPSLFRCPSRNQEKTTTNYVALVGPDATWYCDDPSSISPPVPVIVELFETNQPWMQPGDLEVATLFSSDAVKDKFSKCHGNGALVLYSDASVRFMSAAELVSILETSGEP